MEKYLPKLEFNDLVYELRTMSAVELFIAAIALYYSVTSGQPIFCLISACGGLFVLSRLVTLLGTMARDDYERKRIQCLVTSSMAGIVMLVFVLVDFQLIFQPVVSMGKKHMVLAIAIGLVWLFLDFVNSVMSKESKHIQLSTYFTLSMGQFVLTVCFILCVFLSLISNEESVTFQSLFALIGGVVCVVTSLYAMYKNWVKNPDNVAIVKGLLQKPAVVYFSKYVSHDYILGIAKFVLGIIMKNVFVFASSFSSFETAIAKANVDYTFKNQKKHWFYRVGLVLLIGGFVESLIAIWSYYILDRQMPRQFTVILIFYGFIELLVNLYRVYSLDDHKGLTREGLTYIAIIRMATSIGILIYAVLRFFDCKFSAIIGMIVILLTALISAVVGIIMISRSRFMVIGGKNERN